MGAHVAEGLGTESYPEGAIARMSKEALSSG